MMLIVKEGNAFYEIDEECLKKKKEEAEKNVKDSQKESPG